MKPRCSALLFTLAAIGAFSPTAWAQSAAGGKKSPASKIFIAEAKGETQIVTKGKIFLATQADSFEAPGTVVETKANAHNAFVYSNGTGIYLDQATRVEIARFIQQPFQPSTATKLDQSVEPSVSQSEIVVPHGAVGVCTNQLAAGSTMTYSTALAVLEIRHGRFAIQSAADESIIDLLEGDVSLRPAGATTAQLLHPGDRATVHRGAAGQAPTLAIGPIPQEALKVDDDRTTIACNARQTVSFDTSNDEEIVAKPAVPQNLPANLTVSPDRLPGT